MGRAGSAIHDADRPRGTTVDQFSDHDPVVEAELFARLAAEMEPFLATTSRRDHLATAARLGLVIAGLVAVVVGLSHSVVISAAGYTVALVALVSLGSRAGPAWAKARQLGTVLRQRLRYAPSR